MRMPLNRSLKKFTRLGLVGVLNTIVGYSVILSMLSLGLGDIPANALGYAVGFALGFILNSRWTFQSTAAINWLLVIRYVIAFAISYSVNIMVLLGLRKANILDSWAVHLIGMGIYTVIFYVLANKFVYKNSIEIHSDKNYTAE